MKQTLKSSLLALFAGSLITLGTYIVQAEEAGVLPPEPIIEVVEIIPPVPELLETEETLPPGETISEPIIFIDDIEILPVDVVSEETASESAIPAEENLDELETVEVPESVETVENAPVLANFEAPNLIEEVSFDNLPTSIEDCVGHRFHDYGRPFGNPGECLQYVRSL